MKESEGVHSCGPTCKRPLCVANRRIRELEERLDVRDRHIDALKDERDIFKRTLDKRDAELYEVAKGKAEALQAWPSFERRIRELEASRIAYASEFDGDVGNIHQNIRELKAERDQWQESCGQNYVRATEAEMSLENVEREWERDRLREFRDALQAARIRELEGLVAEKDGQLGRQACRENRCVPFAALEAEVKRLREAIEKHARHTHEAVGRADEELWAALETTDGQ